MYLTTHHVASPTSNRGGVNVFLYLHGSYTWQGSPPPGVPDQNPGTLTAQSISVQPPGNHVLSFLDIVVPDDANWEEVRAGFMDFIGRVQRTPMPWNGHSGRCFFRAGMDLGLTNRWHREVAVLYRAAQALRLANPQ